MEARTKIEELELGHLINQENELQYKKFFCTWLFSRYPDFQAHCPKCVVNQMQIGGPITSYMCTGLILPS